MSGHGRGTDAVENQRFRHSSSQCYQPAGLVLAFHATVVLRYSEAVAITVDKGHIGVGTR